jgi:hypothetical protein
MENQIYLGMRYGVSGSQMSSLSQLDVVLISITRINKLKIFFI